MSFTASLCKEARSILIRHCGEDRLSMSAMPGVHLMQFGWRSLPLVSMQAPCMALVLQGRKSIEYGGAPLVYGAGQFVLASIDVPAVSWIAAATPAQPLLAMAMDIDFAELQEVLQRSDAMPRLQPQAGIAVFDAGEDLLGSIVRLLRLLDHPEQVRPLGTLIRQEILYRLLVSPAGSRLLEICRSGSPSNRIAEATAWIRQQFARGFLVEELAHHVGMSASSLHQNFRSITGMTPIQYQKRIRLQQARRCLFFEGIDIGEASVRVGYESHSQFSKDYRRYFGVLPKDDVSAHLAQRTRIDAYCPAEPA